MKFYVCEHCGNIIQFVKDKGVPVMCCGQKMKEIIPGVSDGAAEKQHHPLYNRRKCQSSKIRRRNNRTYSTG